METTISLKPTDKTLLVTHDQCLDGTGSALMFIWAGGSRDNVVFMPPGKCGLTFVPPEIEEVWFADLCPLDLTGPSCGRPFRVIDHHLSNMRLHQGDHRCTFDMKRSGTSLMAHVLGIDLGDEDDALRLGKFHLVQALEAYDLGRFDEKDGVFLADLAATMSQQEMLGTLVKLGSNVFIDEGMVGRASAAASMRRQYAVAAAKTARRTQFKFTSQTWSVAIAIVPAYWKNDAANLILDEGRTDLVALLDPTSGFVSLRSRDDRVDCSYIAGLYGGGGHAKAAGFKIDVQAALTSVSSEVFG